MKGRRMYAISMRVLPLLAISLVLVACTPEKFGAWLRTQSGSVKEFTQEAKDAAALAKMKADQAASMANEAANRAREVQEGIGKIVEGQKLVREGLRIGTGSMASSR
jgi:hypothetical protein